MSAIIGFSNVFLLAFPPPIVLLNVMPFAMWLLIAYFYNRGWLRTLDLPTAPNSLSGYLVRALYHVVICVLFVSCLGGYVPCPFPLYQILGACRGGLESCDRSGQQVPCWEGIFCNSTKGDTFTLPSLCHYVLGQEKNSV